MNSYQLMVYGLVMGFTSGVGCGLLVCFGQVQEHRAQLHKVRCWALVRARRFREAQERGGAVRIARRARIVSDWRVGL